MRAKPNSEVEMVSELPIDLSRVVPMESAERYTAIQLDTVVRHIRRGHRDGIFPFAERFPGREIERGVRRQIITGIRHAREGVAEARAVVHIRRGVAVPRESGVESNVQRVSLIVVDRGKSRCSITRRTGGGANQA